MSTTLPFVITVALLAIGVLSLVLRPLWRSRPRSTAILIAILTLMCAVLYRFVGTPAALDPQVVRRPQTIEEAMTQLENNSSRFTDHEGWVMLATTYTKLGKSAEARNAWEKVLQYSPNNPDFLAAAAESRAKVDSALLFDTQAVDMLRRALKIDPKHQRSQLFLGVTMRQQDKPAEAARIWESLLTQLDANDAATLRDEIDAARKAAGLSPLPQTLQSTITTPDQPAQTASTQTTSTQTTPKLIVEVVLDPDFASRVRLRGDTSVFVIARAPNGPPMPIAVEKHSIADLPLRVTLDDNDGPMPTTRLSMAKEVEVIARLSASGNAAREEDDLESRPVLVTLPTDREVRLVLGASE